MLVRATRQALLSLLSRSMCFLTRVVHPFPPSDRSGQRLAPPPPIWSCFEPDGTDSYYFHAQSVSYGIRFQRGVFCITVLFCHSALTLSREEADLTEKPCTRQRRALLITTILLSVCCVSLLQVGSRLCLWWGSPRSHGNFAGWTPDFSSDLSTTNSRYNCT